MTKKWQSKKETEEAVAREPTINDCPYPGCKQHFYSPMNKEAHFKLNPSHQKMAVAPEKEEAVLVDLKAKISKGKK